MILGMIKYHNEIVRGLQYHLSLLTDLGIEVKLQLKMWLYSANLGFRVTMIDLGNSRCMF